MLARRARSKRLSPSRFHGLRHQCAVEALRDGMSIYALSKHLGHTSVKTTEIYLAFLTGEEAEAARGVSQKLSQTVEAINQKVA
jgi:integrase/recombinase XerD